MQYGILACTKNVSLEINHTETCQSGLSCFLAKEVGFTPPEVRILSSPQKRTSSVDRADEARAAGAGERTEARKPRRPATKWLGGVQAKWAVLSLVFYLKDNF